jgi:DNA-binding NarL/FixJ family response regulator
MVVTMFGDAALIVQSLEAGAAGYLLKDEVPDQFIASILALQNGGTPISPNLVRSIFDQFIPRRHQVSEVIPELHFSSSDTPPHQTPESTLTPREQQILFDLSLGMTVIRIADKRTISPHSVSQHLRNIYRKLRVRSRSEAVYIARCQGLLQN